MVDIPGHDLVPVDHDPFADEQQQAGQPAPQQGPSQELQAIAQTQQKLLQMEIGFASVLQEIRGTLATMSQAVAELHDKHETLKRTMAAPKRIVRDEDGRPTGVVADHSLH
jgi:hypothetical protein